MVKFPEVLKVRGGKQANHFGYKAQDPVGPQLCRVLRLNNNQKLCRTIQNNLETISRRYLDINAPFSDQPRSKLILMHDEVVRKYPDLFSGGKNIKKLFFAIRFILKEHQSRRSILLGIIRSQSTQSASAEAEGEVLDLTLDESDSDSEKEHIDGSAGGRTHKKSRNKQNLVPSSPSHVQSSDRGANQENEIQIIRQFLSTCVPPMGRFLKHFLDFGCSNEEFLRGLSKWAPEAKEKLLRKVLAGPEGHGASEMELAVIQNQLESYFTHG